MQQELTETNKDMVAPPSGAWGGEEVDSDDIIVPKMALMQPMSKLVVDAGVAKPGEFRDSLVTNRVLGDQDTPVNVIVFGSFKRINRYKNDEWDGSEEWVSGFQREEMDETGAVIVRKLSLNFYCLVAEDIDSGVAFPYVLSFKGMGTGAGKALSTHIKKLEVFKKPSAARVFNIGVSKESNDKGTYFIPTVDMGREASQVEMGTAYKWYQAFNKTKVKVDESADT